MVKLIGQDSLPEIIFLKKIFLLQCCCITNYLWAQTMQISLPFAQVQAYSGKPSLFAAGFNQASMAAAENFSAGLCAERKYFLAGLDLYQLQAILPTSHGNFGFSANYFGNLFYHESTAGLAYSRRMAKTDIGIQFNFCHLAIKGYGNSSAITIEAGAIFHITDQFHTGFHFYNPSHSEPGPGDLSLPLIYTSGFGYDVSENFYLGLVFEKKEDQPINVIAGCKYVFDKKIFAAAGISSVNAGFYFLTGVLLGGLQLELAISYQQPLGCTPSLMIGFQKDNP